MPSLKYSRQRESIKKFLSTRTDHPTADVIYSNIKINSPNISLGTVYRNLNLLAERGEILKFSCGDGSEHFDGRVTPHYHFICHKCNKVSDIFIPSIDHINILASVEFNGKIEGHITYFYGLCIDCKE